MKKRKIIVLLILSFVIFLSGIAQLTFEASSGKLRVASVCTGNNGIKYGKHGNGHWHRATKHKSGWYPQGENLGFSNPCINVKQQTMKSNSEVKSKNNKSTQMKKNKSKSKGKQRRGRQMKKRKAKKY